VSAWIGFGACDVIPLCISIGKKSKFYDGHLAQLLKNKIALAFLKAACPQNPY
jgi:hypothetical protein